LASGEVVSGTLAGCFEQPILGARAEIVICPSKIRGGTGPNTWPEVWDMAKFPGKRTLYDLGQDPVGGCTWEAALFADGVHPDKLYPIDFKRALKSLDVLKPSILKYWAAGAEPVQLLIDKSVTVASAWNGRLAAIADRNKDIAYTWNQGILQWDAWVVSNGAKNTENAMKFLAFAARPEQQANFAELITRAPKDASRSCGAANAA
jgi:putative spermidine/putrescine transport system substrate-binding protein